MTRAAPAPQPAPAPAPPRQGVSRGRRFKDTAALVVVSLLSVLVVSPLILIFWYLISTGVTALNVEFFTRTPAPEGETGGGWLNAIVGSLTMLSLAAVIGSLIGIAGGIFLSEYRRHPLMPTIRMVSDVMAGIPAIVVGLVVYGLVVVPMTVPNPFTGGVLIQTSGGFSGFAGGLALGLLMIPIVVRTTEEVLKLVPGTIREAGLALGLPQWRVILSTVLPAAAGGIVTGILLALARVAGEAAPLLFTAFGANAVSANLSQPMSALPLEIYKGAISAYDENQRMAQAGSLLLILIIFAVSLLARIVIARTARRLG